MQWSREMHAGFSTVEPWLPVGKSAHMRNVDTERDNPDSFLSLYQRLLSLRSQHSVLRTGSLETFGDDDSDVFIYARRQNEEHVYVVLNFSDREQDVALPHTGRVLCCTHPIDYPVIEGKRITLRPYEGALVECSEHPLR
jgi:glycosidase